MSISSERVVRWAGLAAWAAVSAQLLSQLELARLATPLRPWFHSQRELMLFSTAILLSFGAGFAWVMGPGLRAQRPRLLAVLLVWQTLVGSLFETDLIYIVAIALPFVYPQRIAVRWLLLRNLLALPLISYLSMREGRAQGFAGYALLGRIGASLLPHLIWQLFGFAVGLVAVSERARRDELGRLNLRLVAMQELLADRARMEERLDISRELHDSVGHHLAALNVQLELAQHLSQGEARDAVTRAHAVGRRLMGEVRAVVNVFRNAHELDLPSALSELARSVHAPEISVRVQDGLCIERPQSARALLRCAQEFVTNAVKHAGARHVWLELSRLEGGVCLSARDDGRGQARITAGNGIRGIHERAEALGGRVHLYTRPGCGFELEMWLPEAG